MGFPLTSPPDQSGLPPRQCLLVGTSNLDDAPDPIQRFISPLKTHALNASAQ